MPARLKLLGATRVWLVARARLVGDFDVVEGLVYGEFAEHDDLGDAQCGFAVGGVECGGEIVEHFAGGAEGFAGVGE